MKKDIHPSYRDVLFVDSSTDEKYLIGTTLLPKGNKTEVFEGKEYPVQMVDVSRSSHPFFNNQKGRFLDSEGRVNKFYKRYPAQRAQVIAETPTSDQKPAQPDQKAAQSTMKPAQSAALSKKPAPKSPRKS